ncbi:MAG: YdcF family protein, partial [Mycobacteriales bacterium]
MSKTVRRLVAAVLLALVAVVLGTAGRVWWVARQDDRPRSDAIVVLGASQYDGRPSAVFRARLDHAKELFDEHVAPRIVTVGGGAPGDRFTEAQAGANYLAGKGVSAVDPVGVGRNTLQSMKALEQEFKARGWHSAVLVTDPWHSLR